MEILEENKDDITIKLTTPEFLKLLNILYAVGIEYSSLDPEIIDLSKEEVEGIIKEFYGD